MRNFCYPIFAYMNRLFILSRYPLDYANFTVEDIDGKKHITYNMLFGVNRDTRDILSQQLPVELYCLIEISVHHVLDYNGVLTTDIHVPVTAPNELKDLTIVDIGGYTITNSWTRVIYS